MDNLTAMAVHLVHHLKEARNLALEVVAAVPPLLSLAVEQVARGLVM